VGAVRAREWVVIAGAAQTAGAAGTGAAGPTVGVSARCCVLVR